MKDCFLPNHPTYALHLVEEAFFSVPPSTEAKSVGIRRSTFSAMAPLRWKALPGDVFDGVSTVGEAEAWWKGGSKRMGQEEEKVEKGDVS